MTRALLFLIVTLLSSTTAAGPTIQSWETKNGARVYFAQAKELPMVDVRVVFDAGSARDNAAFGLSTLTNVTLDEGAGGLSANQISERFEDKGAQFGSGALRDMAWVSLRSMTTPDLLNAAVDNIATILAAPDFPEKAFERQRKRLLVALEQKKQSPSKLADQAFFEAAYGEHPYAHDPSGTEETLVKLKRNDLKEFYQRYYVARNATVAIVGDLTRTKAQKLANTLVGQLKEGQKAGPLAKVERRNEPIDVRIDHPSTQTHIRFGQPALTRDDPDYFSLYIGNHALGGSGLVSRLSEEIREKRGLSYSVYSYFSPMRLPGPFVAGLQTKNEQAADALKVMKDTIDSYIGQGPSKKELESSMKNITGGFPLRIDSNAKIVQYLAVIGFYNLPIDYLDTFVEKIRNTDAEQIKTALKKRLMKNNFVTVVVGGDRSK